MLSFIIIEAAYEVYGVEVRGVLHGFHGAGIGLVDLDAFEDLEAGAAVFAGDDVGAAAGFAFVTHHAAHADGAVQLFAEHFHALFL